MVLAAPAETSRAAPRLALPWIVRLRFAMAAGQWITAAAVDRFLQIDLPLRWIWIAPAIVVLSNFWLWKRSRSKESATIYADSTLISCFFVLDTLCLTAVLMLSGGPNNPFSLLYLVHITLSATILTQRQTWFLGFLSTACFGLLFWWYRPIPALEMHHHGDGVSLHLTGMWVGFAVASLLIAMFSGRISALLREREESLLAMQEELARKERLASLVTLAAGAAHELNTPLGTIAVVANELEHYATGTVRDGAIAEDSRLIRTEVERCREILRRMSVDGAEPAGEAMELVSVAAVSARAAASFRGIESLRVDTARVDPSTQLRIPPHAVEQALVALIKNAFDASIDDAEVRLTVTTSDSRACFAVSDSGTGMSTETLRHVGEPFYTTKDPGKGMGLGIFLVQTLADRLGGQLSLESRIGIGTTARLFLPLATVPAPDPSGTVGHLSPIS